MINLISPINLLWPSRTFRQAAEAELRQTAISYATRESWPQVKRAHALLPPQIKIMSMAFGCSWSTAVGIWLCEHYWQNQRAGQWKAV